jgi:sugar phosphate isomerase/epimerase
MKYSVFTVCLPQCTPVEAARLIKEAGYDGVEWRCTTQPDTLPPIPNPWSSNRATLDVRNWKQQAPELRAITHDNGLETSNLAAYCCADNLDSVKIAIEIAKTLDCPRLRVTSPPYDGRSTYHEVFARARSAFEQVVEVCRDAGLQALVELHAGNITPSAALAHRLLDGLDSKHIGVIYDPGNMMIEGYENWKLGCELLGPYLAFCHAKNSRLRAGDVTASGAIRWTYEASTMHTGFVDWLEVFKAFRAAGYDGWISNEDHHMELGVSLEVLRQGLQHLRRCETMAAEAD